MQSPNWNECEDRLFFAASDAINRFAVIHTGYCSHFAFDADPLYGYVLCAFDTPENSLQTAKRSEIFALKRRERDLNTEEGWKFASVTLKLTSVSPFCDSTGDFAFQHFVDVKFPEWREFWEADSSADPQESNCDDYLGGNVRVLLWKTAERLIAAGAFEPLTKTSPFLISYSMQDEEQRVLRVLNWPQ